MVTLLEVIELLWKEDLVHFILKFVTACKKRVFILQLFLGVFEVIQTHQDFMIYAFGKYQMFVTL